MTLPVANKYNIQIGKVTQANFNWLKEKNYAGWGPARTCGKTSSPPA